MLDDDFMIPLLRQARMGFVNPLIPAWWTEYKADPLVSQIQQAKGLEAHEAEKELRAWVLAHGGDVRIELFRPKRVGSMLPPPPHASLIAVLPDAAIPPEQESPVGNGEAALS